MKKIANRAILSLKCHGGAKNTPWVRVTGNYMDCVLSRAIIARSLSLYSIMQL